MAGEEEERLHSRLRWEIFTLQLRSYRHAELAVSARSDACDCVLSAKAPRSMCGLFHELCRVNPLSIKSAVASWIQYSRGLAVDARRTTTAHEFGHWKETLAQFVTSRGLEHVACDEYAAAAVREQVEWSVGDIYWSS